MIEKTQTFQCVCFFVLFSSLFFFFFSQARFATVTLQCTCHFCLFSSLARFATLQCTCHMGPTWPGLQHFSAHVVHVFFPPWPGLQLFSVHVMRVLPGQVCNTSLHMSCVSFSSLPRFADSDQVSGGDPSVCDDSPTRG